MAVRPIVRMGTKSLYERAKEAPLQEIGTPALNELIQDMHDTMQALKGVGIAAPQIGVNKRVIIFGMTKHPRYPKAKPVPLTVLINPEVSILTQEQIADWEGCMCVPGIRGKVPRYTKLRYTGYTPEGEKIDCTVDGFHAVVVQHEYDHLNGFLFPQRIKDFSEFGYEEEVWERIYEVKKGV